MVRASWYSVIVAAFVICGCQDSSEPNVEHSEITGNITTTKMVDGDRGEAGTDAKLSIRRRSPISIGYQLPDKVATIGQALSITIQFGASTNGLPMEVHYHSDDPHGLSLASSQPESVLITPDEQGVYPAQQVAVMPLRDGRFYLQVSAGLQTGSRLLMRPLAIPVQVGTKAATRKAQNVTMSDAERGISLPARMD